MSDELGRVPAVSLAGVTKRFGHGREVLREISVTVAPGEFVSLIGPSGCGKSTLLKVVAGLTPVSEGTVLVDGMTPGKARETVSFIFQDPTLLPWRTVRGNVGLGMELEGIARERRAARVTGLLETVGLAEVGEAYPRQLSGGMKMRVSIARALASQPRLLLMDEPFAALDEMTRDRMNEELLRLRRESGWTALFVTHSVAEAVFLSGRVLVLRANPGQVRHEVTIDLPEERTAGLRGTEAFDRVVARVSRLLREVQEG